MADQAAPAAPTSQVVPIAAVREIQQENIALRKMVQEVKAKKPKAWYKKWCRVGGLIAVIGPIVNHILGNPVPQWTVMLVVGSIIAWIGTENYKDQKIAVAKVLQETQIDVERLKMAATPAFKQAMEKLRTKAQSPEQPK